MPGTEMLLIFPVEYRCGCVERFNPNGDQTYHPCEEHEELMRRCPSGVLPPRALENLRAERSRQVGTRSA